MTIMTVKTEGKTLSKLLYTFDNLSIKLKRKDVSFSKLEEVGRSLLQLNQCDEPKGPKFVY